MKSSSPPPSSSSSSSSTSEIQSLSSSSSTPPPHQSLQSPELQAEFLRERQNKFRSHSDFGESSIVSSATSPSSCSSPLSSPFSPTLLSSPCSSSSTSSSPTDNRQARLSLSSPELLSELKDLSSWTLRHVPEHNGLTTVFSGRGRGRGQASNPAPSTRPANQKTSH